MANFHLKRSSTANKRPTSGQIAHGELGLNINATSTGIFLRGSDDSIVKLGPVGVSVVAPNSSPAGSAGNTPGELWLQNGPAPTINVFTGNYWTNFTKTVPGDGPLDSLVNAEGTRVSPTAAWGLLNIYTAPGVGPLPFTCITTNTTTAPGCAMAGGGTPTISNFTTYTQNANNLWAALVRFVDQVGRRRTIGGLTGIANCGLLGDGGSTLGVDGSGGWYKVGALFGPCSLTDSLQRKYRDITTPNPTSGTHFWTICQFGKSASGTQPTAALCALTGSRFSYNNGDTVLQIDSTSFRFARNISGSRDVSTSPTVAFNTGFGSKNTLAIYDDGTVLRFSLNGGAWTAFSTNPNPRGSNYVGNWVAWGGSESNINGSSNFGVGNPLGSFSFYMGNAAGMPTPSSLLSAANALHLQLG